MPASNNDRRGPGNPAFLILAHDDAQHAARLVDRLEPHAAFIHLDSKTRLDKSWEEVKASFVQDRVPVYWAGFSQVEATLRLLRDALRDPRAFTHFVLLSGSCYPTRPVSEFVEELSARPNVNLIKWVETRDSPHLTSLLARPYFRDGVLPAALHQIRGTKQLERVLRKAIESALALSSLRSPAGWTTTHGSAYWALTRDAADYVVRFADSERGRTVERFYRRTFASDEQYFHSVIANSPHKETSSGRIPFQGRGTFRTANFHLIDPSLKKWFSLADLDTIVDSSQYFVRKVSTTHSGPLLDALDERIRSA